MTQKTIFNITEAARLLGVTAQTLRVWESEGKISPVYTPGGHRRYTQEEINRVLGLERDKPGPKKKTCVVYVRVPSKKEADLGRLVRQEERLVTYAFKNNLEIIEVFSEIGGCYSSPRPELLRLIDFLKQRSVNYIIVEKRDCLLHLGYNLLEQCLRQLGTEIIPVSEDGWLGSADEYLREMLHVTHYYCDLLFGNKSQPIVEQIETILRREMADEEMRQSG